MAYISSSKIGDSIEQYRDMIDKIKNSNTNSEANELVKMMTDAISDLESIKSGIYSINSEISDNK